MPILERKTILVAKQQPTAGTYVEPAATDWVEVIDFSAEPLVADVKELELLKKSFGAYPKRLSGYRVKISFSIALAGSGTAGTAPYWGVLERICGMAQTIVAITSVTYSPADASYEMGSLAFYFEGNKHAMRDARGTSSLDVDANGWFTRRYEITGVYIDPVTATIPAVATLPRIMPELLLSSNTTFTLHGQACCLKKLSIETGNDIKYRSLMGCVDVLDIAGRMVSGSVEIVAESLTLKNWFTTVKSEAFGILDFTHNSTGTAGKRLAINAPNVQLLNPKYGSYEGIKTLTMDLNIVPTAVGADDYKIVNT